MTGQPAPVAAPALPRWGEQTSFVQRHQPAFWLFLVIVGLTGLEFLFEQATMFSAEPAAWIATVILLVPYAVPVIALIYLLDLYEREPISILVAALAWGGIAATVLAMYTNTPLMEIVFKLSGGDTEFTTAWAAALTAPFVEELFKGLGIVLLIAIARPELDDVLDGFVWGAMVGVGFLLVEDVFYFVRAANDTGTAFAVIPMFLIRILGAGPYSHFLYTGLVGMGLATWHVRGDLPTGRRLVMALALVAAGVGAHFLWNSPILSDLLDGSIPGWIAYMTVKGLPMLVGLGLVVRLARARERRWFATLAAGFADDGSITPAELRELSGLRSRRRARIAAGRAHGRGGKRLQGRLQAAQLGLAMAFTKYGSEAHPEVARRVATIATLRAELAALGSGSAPAATGGAWPGATAGWGAAAAGGVVAAPAWMPTHRVPDGGLPAWIVPDPTRPPGLTLDAHLELAVVERAGDWARVVAVNGWSGWVDGRRLQPRA